MTLPTYWEELNSSNQIEILLKESKVRPVLIFKHSTRCSISRMVMKQFQDMDIGLKTYYLDLIKHQLLSSQIAQDFNVIHQSPQLLVIKNGEVIHHASHADIIKVRVNDLS